MENQEPNLPNYPMQSPRPRQRMKLGAIFIPLLVDFGVTLLIEAILCMVIFMNVFTQYSMADSELLQAIESVDYSDMDAAYESMEEILSEEVLEELTLIWIEAVENNIVMITALGALVTVPIFLWMMKRDRKKGMMAYLPKRVSQESWKYIFVAIGSISLCVALNNLLTLSQLAEVSQLYQETSEGLYAESFVVQLVALGVIIPIAEELLFRGVIYNRLGAHMSLKAAGIWSAVIFAAYHVNIVQMIYAGVVGVLLAWLYEKYGSIKAPILAHIGMNLTSVILTQYDLFIWIFEEPIRMTLITVIGATLTSMMYIMINNHTREDLLAG